MKGVIQIKKEHEDAVLPSKANFSDAGLDLVSVENAVLPPGGRAKISTGLCMGIPHGYVGLIWPRSKLAANYGLDVLAGVVDSGYIGTVMVSLINHGDRTFDIKPGDKLAQMIIQSTHSDLPIVEVVDLRETDRGASGINDSELRLR